MKAQWLAVLGTPVLAAIAHPAAGPVVALAAVAVLSGFDRLPAALEP